MAQIAREMNVECLCMFDEAAARELSKELGKPVLSGMDGLCELASDPKTDIVLNSLMGSVGCLPTLSAIRSSKHIALANKETLVMAGEVIQDALAANPKAYLTPVDSEHNAIFQCLADRPKEEVENLQITASGGPFREWPLEKFKDIRVEDALNHPVWSMGKKITIDSASMMNKGLEVIEAHFLFHIPYEQIQVVVHPQSRVHSLVQFRDGSLMAQLGAPDMRLPIQYALTFPERLGASFPRLDLFKTANLTFEKPDLERFPNLRLAYEAMHRGGNMPCVLNAANEVVNLAFREGKMGFLEMSDVIGKTMEKTTFVSEPSYEDYVASDADARRIAAEMIRGGK